MSFIYDLTCRNCGKSLNYTASMDSSEDIYIIAELCEDCIKESYDQGVERGKEDNSGNTN